MFCTAERGITRSGSITSSFSHEIQPDAGNPSGENAAGGLRLYHFAASGNSRIVRIVLAEKGLEYERVNVNVIRGDNRKPEFLALNPRGKVPVLVHSRMPRDTVVCEATVIAEYLEDAFPNPPLMPADPAGRAAVRALIHFFDTELAPVAGPLILETLLKPEAARRADVLNRHREMTHAALQRMMTMLADGDWLAGAYSLADASCTPVASVMDQCGIKLEAEFPRLAKWLEAAKRRASYLASER